MRAVISLRVFGREINFSKGGLLKSGLLNCWVRRILTREAFRKTRVPGPGLERLHFQWNWELVGGGDRLGPSISIRAGPEALQVTLLVAVVQNQSLIWFGIEVRKEMKIQGKSVPLRS